MKLKIPYDKDIIETVVPDRNISEIIYPNTVKIENPEAILQKALNNPIGMKSFQDFLNKSKDILFVINDATRPTPTALILKLLSERMDLNNAKYIIATGVHRAPTEEEFNFIFGNLYNKLKPKIIVHNAKKKEDLVYLGSTEYGTEVWINKNVRRAHSLIPIGSIEPHYFGGFTGGRKFLVPGLAGYKTCEQNHKLALLPGAEPLKMKGNPIHEDFISAIKKISDKPIFSIQTVVNGNEELFAATSGDIIKSHLAATEFAKEVFCVPIREKTDIVITVATPPMNLDLYQSHKAIQHGKMALNKNGIIILISECKEGIGPEKFLKFLSSSNSPDEIIAMVKKEYKLGYHIATKLAELKKRAEVWSITDIDNNIMEGTFIQQFNSIQGAIDKAIKEKGVNAKITFLMDGCMTIPLIK